MYVVNTSSAIILFSSFNWRKKSKEKKVERTKEKNEKLLFINNERKLRLYNIKSRWNWIENVLLLFNIFPMLGIFFDFLMPLSLGLVRPLPSKLFIQSENDARANPKAKLKILTDLGQGIVIFFHFAVVFHSQFSFCSTRQSSRNKLLNF